MNLSEHIFSLTKNRTMREKLVSTLQNLHCEDFEASGATLLHYAAKCNNIWAVNYCLRKGCNIDAQDQKGRTPLMISLKEEEIVQLLLAAGADILIRDHKGMNVINMLCIEYEGMLPIIEIMILNEFRKKCLDSIDAAKKLIDADCQLYQAAFIRDAKVIKYMLQQGIPVNSKQPTEGFTALIIATYTDNLKMLKLLLKYGADVQALAISGSNALGFLLHLKKERKAERFEILKLLLDAGISTTTCTNLGLLQVGRVLDDADCDEIGLVLQSNIDFTAKDASGWNLLHYLVTNEKPGIAEKLKPYINKFNFNEVNNEGNTPLQYAAKLGNFEMVKFLIDHGSDPNYAEYPGHSPLYYTCEQLKRNRRRQYDKCTEILLENNADPQLIRIDFEYDRQTTVFNFTPINKSIKSVIAHLAVLKGLGTPIKSIVRRRINSDSMLKKYFHRYREILKRQIFGSTTLLKLLTCNDREMARHLRDKNLVLKLKQISRKQKIKTLFSYYHSALVKRFNKGMEYRRLKNKSAIIISKIFKGRLNPTDLVIDKTIDYLSKENLMQLCQI